MEKFTTLTAIAAPLPLANVDTDKILAARYLKTIKRSGLGDALFATLRQDPDFVLNRPPWTAARILVAGENFGCGSSREHAPWALLDFGFRCVIAPSFADIFYNNCFKNGILPIRLCTVEVDRLMKLASDVPTATFAIDLSAQVIRVGDAIVEFAIDQERKRTLLEGKDEVGVSLDFEPAIELYEQRAWSHQPWLKGKPTGPWPDRESDIRSPQSR